MVRPLGTCTTVLTVSALALLVGCSGESAPMTQPAISPAASTSQSPSESGAPLPEGVILMSDPTPSGCGDQPYHWVDDQGGSQGLGPGKRQRLWILDVAGERVMILAGWFPAGAPTPPPE
jgi:hypothetical protein